MVQSMSPILQIPGIEFYVIPQWLQRGPFCKAFSEVEKFRPAYSREVNKIAEFVGSENPSEEWMERHVKDFDLSREAVMNSYRRLRESLRPMKGCLSSFPVACGDIVVYPQKSEKLVNVKGLDPNSKKVAIIRGYIIKPHEKKEYEVVGGTAKPTEWSSGKPTESMKKELGIIFPTEVLGDPIEDHEGDKKLWGKSNKGAYPYEPELKICTWNFLADKAELHLSGIEACGPGYIALTKLPISDSKPPIEIVKEAITILDYENGAMKRLKESLGGF